MVRRVRKWRISIEEILSLFGFVKKRKKFHFGNVFVVKDI